MTNIRIGNGFDVHAFKKGRKLILGGVDIESDRGLDGHSDADVLVHAIIDSLLGAANIGDIGRLFPDTDAQFKDISSITLLSEVGKRLLSRKISIINVDSIVVCEKPKISPHAESMKENISAALGNLDIDRIGIKGKTTEKLGFTGRGEGISVYSVALIEL
ncbi:MAG: 2-C-methyl-D-erythritol 2,4-cyclodiphosphate synthase [bacterium]|nr:2-C-methyl-D-erythritol 2,4-cyclodiphosphate synthase [bacterium]